MAEKEFKLIEITHFINPHLFWFKYVDNSSKNHQKNVERELSKFAQKSYNDVRTPALQMNEKVAVYLVSKNKWIRAVIDEYDSSNDFVVLWAIDYGFPFKSSTKFVTALDDEFSSKLSMIVRGGVYGVIPSKIHLNHEKRVLNGITIVWDEFCVEKLKDIVLLGKSKCYFKSKFVHDKQHFGELRIESVDNKGKPISMSAERFLCSLKSAQKVDRFEKDILKLPTHAFDRWLNNNSKMDCLINEGAMPIRNIPRLLDDPDSSLSQSQLVPCSTVAIKNAKPTWKTNISQATLSRLRALKIGNSLKHMQHKEFSMGSKTESSASCKLIENEKSSKTATVVKKQDEMMKSSRDRSRERSHIMTLKIKSNQPKPKPAMDDPLSSVVSTSSVSAVKSESKIWNKLKMIPIFHYNDDVEPCQSIGHANLTNEAHRAMKKMNFQEPYVLQSYAWPNIMRGNSVIIIDSKNRGKSMAYQPALCSIIRNRQETSTEHSSLGTSAIIVCMSDSVSAIANNCRNLLNTENWNRSVVEGDSKTLLPDIIAMLCNGCSILVVTVSCLELLLKECPYLNNDKLKYVAVENMDVLKSTHGSKLVNVIKLLAFNKLKSFDRQFMITSRTWLSSLEIFLKADTYDANLFIGNLYEAARFGKAKMMLVPVQSEAKLEKLLEHIEQVLTEEGRGLIICQDDNETRKVKVFLESNDIPHKVAENKESGYELGKLKTFWQNKKGVIIANDEVLAKMEINDAYHVIHYSPPLLNFRQFQNRFVVQTEIFGGTDATDQQKAPVSRVFMDETNDLQWAKMIELIGPTVPEEFKQIAKEIRIQLNAKRIGNLQYEPICNFVFVHGTNNHKECQKRHMLLPSDVPTGEMAYINKEIRFAVQKVISPTEYIVRPLQMRTANGYTNINASNEFINFDMEFRMHCLIEGHLKSSESIEIGQLCVVIDEHYAYRGEVIEISDDMMHSYKNVCRVRLIDVGDVYQREKNEIFQLDKKFADFPGQAYRMHLSGVLPVDGEQGWSPKICQVFKQHVKKLMKLDTEHLVFDARVVFSLRNDILVDIVRASNIEKCIVRLSFEKELIRKKWAIPSDDCLKKVKETVKLIGIDFPKKIKKSMIDKNENEIISSENVVISDANTIAGELESGETNQIQCFDKSNDVDMKRSQHESSDISDDFVEEWLPAPKIDNGPVAVTYFDNPHNLHINYKNNEQWKLCREIDAYIDNFEKSSNHLHYSLKIPDPGEYCLVKQEEEFYRGKVIDFTYDETDKMKVFLVDIGETIETDMDNVYNIPERLLKTLPFQTMWCRLAGIKSTDWSYEENDHIHDEIDEFHDCLYAEYIPTETKRISNFHETEIPCYDVILFAIDNGKKINLNARFIEKNFVTADESFNMEMFNNSCEPDANGEDAIAQDDANDNGLDNNNNEIDDDFDYDGFAGMDDEIIVEFYTALKNQADNSQRVTQANNENEFEEEKLVVGNNDHEINEGILNQNHRLVYKYKRPSLIWQQDETWIILKFKANDDVKYNLEVTPKTVIYNTLGDDVPVAAILNLFGGIVPQQTQHIVRGLNVVVRLKKTCYLPWPRLITTAQKFHWIKANLEKLSYDDVHLYKKRYDLVSNGREIDSESEAENGDDVERLNAFRMEAGFSDGEDDN